MKTRSRSICTAFLLAILLSIANPALSQLSPAYRYLPPAELNDGIKTGTLRSAKIDNATIIAGANEILKGTYPNIHSLLIIRNGRLVFEEYFTGEDSHRGKGRLGSVVHSRDTLHDLRSVTKSIVGLAVIHALAKGTIKGLDQPIFDFFPEHLKYAVGEKKSITVRHLLTMSPGLVWKEDLPYTDPANSETAMDRSVDPSEFVLSQNVIAKPGSTFNYNGGATHLLAEIIRKATGLAADEYVSRHLFAPLGIEKFEWVKGRNGYLIAASGLRLRSRDLAKISLMVMNDGKWNGKQIIPANLVREATTKQIALPQGPPGMTMDYGYQVWLPSLAVGDSKIALIGFNGNGGQVVQIDKERKLISVVTAGNYNQWDLKKSSEDIHPDIVHPAVVMNTKRNRQ